MNFLSTRNRDLGANLSQAIAQGIAPDGGLYVPEQLPVLPSAEFPEPDSLDAVATHLLRQFAAGDSLEAHLASICREALDFPAPLVPLDGARGPASVLQLFHGPTCAFKDFGARFLASTLERVHRGCDRTLTILVATSGDTGAAVAAAFHQRHWVNVILLYPKGLVSPRQAHQLACWGGNVRTFAVLGTFDDCQRIVKEAFRDPSLMRSYTLSSANSINVGRLLPQMAYYAYASLRIWRTEGRKPNFIIPSGNLGNAAACIWVREMGLPVGDIVLSTNENRTIADYVAGGTWQPRPSVATLASAMDVGNPSNMERLRWLFPNGELRQRVTAYSVSDDEIRSVIRSDVETVGQIWCPHTATAACVYWQVVRSRPREHWVLVATAHPAKFNDIVEPLIGREIPVPPALDRLLRLPRQEEDLSPTLEDLRARLR